jgi:regulator of replication initiation timing
MQIIERNKAILNRKETQIKNFQGVYEVQLEDLDKKMSYLIEENKHLKVKNQEINKTYAPSIK